MANRFGVSNAGTTAIEYDSGGWYHPCETTQPDRPKTQNIAPSRHWLEYEVLVTDANSDYVMRYHEYTPPISHPAPELSSFVQDVFLHGQKTVKEAPLGDPTAVPSVCCHL